MTIKTNYILFKTFYLGDDYYGSQRQPDLLTVEGAILKALHKKGYLSDAHYEDQIIHSAGRTDAGVHARAMTYGFFNQREDFHPMEVNTALPDTILIWSATKILVINEIPTIHPRFQALQRQYKFFVQDVNQKLNTSLVRRVVTQLTGTHDFRNFAKTHPNTNTIRTIDKIEFQRKQHIWEFDFQAKSFLWNQIRKMMRVILEVGKSNWSFDVVHSLLDPNNTSYATKLEPLAPEGLILWNILYPSGVKFQNCEISVQKLNNLVSTWIQYHQVRELFLKQIQSSFKQT
ncbi:MAG: tRNA pseudouridine(38-40) synthase TruA [Candidatus Lokiarchaeota archaeon]|nr:tRNA pseudouridine(38-40) synthase TruA [Candidatus Lokiarchaeota archaeon]